MKDRRARPGGNETASPHQRPPLSIQTQIVLLVLLVLVPMFLAQGAISYDRVRGRQALALQLNLEFARAVGKTFTGFCEGVLNEELALGTALTSSQPLAEQDVNRLLEKSKTAYPAVRCFSFAGPDGTYLASLERGVLGLNISDRSHFQAIVAGKEWTVSNLLVSRIFGDPVFIISRGIRDETGRLLGVVVAVVVPERLDKILSIERNGGGTITVLDRDGTAVYRYPAVDWNRDQRSRPKSHQMVREALEGRESSGTLVSDFDGQTHLAAAVPIPSVGWVVGAGIPESQAMTPMLSDILLHVVLFLSVAVATLCCGLVVSRRIASPVKKLRDHALLLGRGKLPDRIDLDGSCELQDLAQAFHVMSQEVRSREAALLEVQEELERRVAERTAELEQANESLKAEVDDHNRAKDVIKAERQRLISVLNGLPAFVFLLAPDYSFRFANRMFERLFGKPAGRACYAVQEGASQPCRKCPAQEVLRTHCSQEWEWTHERSGKVFQVYGYPFSDIDGSLLTLTLGIDITERKRAEESLREAEQELRFLSSRLLSAQEEERKRIAGELHDSLGSSLSAIKMGLEIARTRMERGETLVRPFDAPIQWAQEAIDEARRLMMDLRPSVLDDLGLLAALQWFFNQYRSVHPPIHIEEEIRTREEEIPETLKTTIFRITQEAFHNIAKYSQAEFVRFALAKTSRGLELTVEDNGEGFDLPSMLSTNNPNKGLGLTTMKERTELSGGSFEITSVAGEGTTIRAFWLC